MISTTADGIFFINHMNMAPGAICYATKVWSRYAISARRKTMAETGHSTIEQ
jgi:hypothetical protein